MAVVLITQTWRIWSSILKIDMLAMARISGASEWFFSKKKKKKAGVGADDDF